MNLIYDVTSTLTQTALDVFCQNYHIPDTIHPELPGPNQNIRNSLAGKIGVYTRFFDFANFQIPLSRFLVDVLEYFSINLSQLSVIAAAKISHFDSLKNWNNSFFWLMRLFSPLSFLGTLRKRWRETHLLPRWSLVRKRIAFIRHADPTKVRIGKRQIEKGQVPLLDSTNDSIENIGHDGSGDANQENRSEGSDRACQDEAVTIVVDEEFQAAAANKPKSKKKKRRAVGASGSDHPPKKLREDHGTSSDIGVSTGRKSLVALQGLLERSTLAAEVDVIVAATVPFITSSVTPTPEREGGGNTDYVSGLNLHTHIPSKRFVIFSDSSHHSSTNVADDEVTSLVRSFVSPPPMMIAAVTTTNVVGASSASVLGVGVEPVSQVHPSIFADSASIGAIGPDVAGPSNPAGTELSADTFYVSQETDSVTLRRIYVPKWNVVNESVLDDPDV
ncbi:hypothetical protein Tco_0085600 [Tanacetum coccineum]